MQITREEAIAILLNNTNLGYGIVIEGESTAQIKEALNMAIEALKEPKKGGWIPVSERLPTFEERVLTTNTDGIIQEAKLEPCKYGGDELFWMMPSGAYFHFNRIVAWMPLPEPYKAESEETE